MIVRRYPNLAVLTVTAVALLGAGSVFAQEATHEYDRPLVLHSDTSHAQVMADAAAFRASGQLPGDSSKLHVTPHREKSLQTRAEVNAETVRAMEAHEIVNHGEIYSATVSRPQRLAQR